MDKTPVIEEIVVLKDNSHRNDLLKIIAIVTMVIDHIGYLFFPGVMIFRTIGRIAFPIFAYQLALGYQKTSSLKAYASRLLLFAIVAQIPYFWFNPNLEFEYGKLNILFTLLASLAVLYAFDHCRRQCVAYKTDLQFSHLLKALGYALVFIALLVLPEYISCQFKIGFDYGVYGQLLVLLFYVYRNRLIPLLGGYVALSLFYAYYRAGVWYHYAAGVPYRESLTDLKALWNVHITYEKSYKDLTGVFFQSRSIMALLVIWLMNKLEDLGTIRIRLNKYVGYWFYPAHVAVLVLIRYLTLPK